MKEKNPSHAKLTLAHYFLFLLLFAALFASYKMVAPYLGPIILALIFAAMANPVYQWFVEKTKGRENLSAALVCLLLTLLIVVPCMIMLSVIIAQGIDSVEAINRWVAAGNLAKLKEAALVKTAVGLMHRYLPPDFLEVASLQSLAIKSSSTAGRILVSQSGQILGNISMMAGKFVLMIFVFFFVLKDQQRLYDYILHLLPMSARHETVLIQKMKDVSRSAILGSFITAVAQGAAGGIAFAICGLPGFFWGAVMAFASLIPVVGTALVWVPAVVYLMISGKIGLGIFLVIWCVVVVGMIDNFLRPLFMRGGAGMSTVVVFFAILGGIHLFGLIGLIYGPLIFGITLVLLYIYELEFEAFLKGQDRI
ncbi:MAG: AI-2E family transporter [Thermodesulfobacteriota bacterium]